MTSAASSRTTMQKIMNPVGFSKSYNFFLWFIFSGALFGFALARSAYLNFDIFCNQGKPVPQLQAGPGECYYYLNFDRYRIGIRIHLFGIILGSFLVLFQFVPVIRHKARLFHRINGYIVVILVTLANVGALMIAKVAFGGTFSTQVWVGTVAILTEIFLILAWVNIKRLQIDQHRAWMLRTWFYLASIITQRFIFSISFTILTKMGGWYFAMPCAKIAFLLKSNTALTNLYPGCAAFIDGSNLDAHVAVLGNTAGRPEQFAAMMGFCFGGALWLALAMHAAGIEIYLRLTPAEGERLRRLSLQRQVERGLSRPGNSGLTVQRLGDAEPWNPAAYTGSTDYTSAHLADDKLPITETEKRRPSSLSDRSTNV